MCVANLVTAVQSEVISLTSGLEGIAPTGKMLEQLMKDSHI